MDSWASDSFYSHFPSYSDQKTQREILAKSRHLEYQNYLSRLASVVNDARTSKRGAVVNRQHKRQKLPATEYTNDHAHHSVEEPIIQKNHSVEAEENPYRRQVESQNHDTSFDETPNSDRSRNRLLDNIENMDLPDIFNEDVINERNRKIAEEKHLKKIQYQRDLMAQIEQKRREREERKAKELEDDDRLTRKMEEQLKMVRLQDELERQRQTREREHKRINLEINNKLDYAKQHHLPPSPSTTYADSNNEKLSTYRSYDERKAQSENGKENIVKSQDDKEIYKYFTNSARRPNGFQNIRYIDYREFHNTTDDDIFPDSMSSSYHTHPSLRTNRNHDQYCKQCLNDTINHPSMCNFCKQNRLLMRSQKENTVQRHDRAAFLCSSCRNEPICMACCKEMCVRCNKPTTTADNHSEISENHFKLAEPCRQYNCMVAVERPKRQSVPSEIKTFRLSEETHSNDSVTDEENNFDNHDRMKEKSINHKPYSFNVEKSSIFHPSKSTGDAQRLKVNVKNGEVFVEQTSFDELKRITDAKLSKYAKNYGELLSRADSKHKSGNSETFSTISDNNRRKVMEFVREHEDVNNSAAFKRLESKWQIPDVQKYGAAQPKTDSSSSSTCVFTQTGAFRKEIQSKQLDGGDNGDRFNSNKY